MNHHRGFWNLHKLRSGCASNRWVHLSQTPKPIHWSQKHKKHTWWFSPVNSNPRCALTFSTYDWGYDPLAKHLFISHLFHFWPAASIITFWVWTKHILIHQTVKDQYMNTHFDCCWLVSNLWWECKPLGSFTSAIHQSLLQRSKETGIFSAAFMAKSGFNKHRSAHFLSAGFNNNSWTKTLQKDFVVGKANSLNND